MEAFSDCQLWWGREENNLQMPVHDTRPFKSAWLDKDSWANTALGKSFPCCHEGNAQICSKGSRVIKEDENCVKTVRSFRTWEVFRKRVWNLQVSELIFTQTVRRPWKGWDWLGQHQRRLSRVLKSCPTLLPDILHGCQSPSLLYLSPETRVGTRAEYRTAGKATEKCQRADPSRVLYGRPGCWQEVVRQRALGRKQARTYLLWLAFPRTCSPKNH